MLNGKFSFRYHLTLIASTRHKLQMPLSLSTLMFIADCINKVSFFLLPCIMCTHHLQHINTLCMIIHHYIFFTQFAFYGLASTIIYSRCNVFRLSYRRSYKLFQAANSSFSFPAIFFVRSSSVSTKDLCWLKICLLLLNGKTAVIQLPLLGTQEQLNFVEEFPIELSLLACF